MSQTRRSAQLQASTPVPIYYQLQELILKDIENGSLLPGRMIPTERHLGESCGVSIGTVKKAILNLVHQGYLYRIQGKATFVTGTTLRRESLRYYRLLESFGGLDDALAFNHFEEFFGIKDPLQFRFEIIAEGETRRCYLVLGPSQSVNLNLKTLMPERKGAVCMKVFVAHPFLTRGRHYRFRICGDVFWKDSFTIIHGSHQFFKNPNKVQRSV